MSAMLFWRGTLRGVLAFFGLIAAALGALGGGSALAGGLALAGAVAPIASSLASSKRERKAQKQQRDDLAASEASSQAKFRDTLRGNSGSQGTGDFRQEGSSFFDTQLKTVTGR